MPNVISSPIANAPLPELMRDILNQRNKIHHLDDNTDEDLIPLFDWYPETSARENKRLLPRRNWCSITETRPDGSPPVTPPTSNSRANRGTRWPFKLSRTDSYPAKLLRRLSLVPGPGADNPTPYSLRYENFSSGTASANEKYIPADDSYFPPQFAGPRTGPHHNTTPPQPLQPYKAEGTPGRSQSRVDNPPPRRYIELEDGLDVDINFEQDQGNPAGKTLRHGLLIPALWYEGDPEQPPPPTPRLKRNWTLLGRRKSLFQRDKGATARPAHAERTVSQMAGDRNGGTPLVEPVQDDAQGTLPGEEEEGYWYGQDAQI